MSVGRANVSAGKLPVGADADRSQSGITSMWPGSPYPLGATFDGAGTNFAL